MKVKALMAVGAAIMLLAGCSGGGDAEAGAGGDVDSAQYLQDNCPSVVETVGAGDAGDYEALTAGVIYPTDDRLRYFEYDAVNESASPAGFIEVETRFCFDATIEPLKADVDGHAGVDLYPIWNADHQRGEEPESMIYIEGPPIRVATDEGSSQGAQGFAVDPDYLEQ